MQYTCDHYGFDVHHGTALSQLFCIVVLGILANMNPLEREVKKANRELNTSMSKMDELQKIETLQKRVTEHLADMKRLERENLKNKKRGDMLQKEKDHGRTELSKSVQLKEKLEKLCRELQKENNRLKVKQVYEGS